MSSWASRPAGRRDDIVPRLFIPAERLVGGRIQPTPAELRHLRAMRVQSGASIRIFDDQGVEYQARVLQIDSRGAEIDLGARLGPATGGGGPPLTLIAAILKGQRMDTLVEKSTELGVERIIPAVTEFTIARPERGTDRVERWRRVAISAATQCGRVRIPTVDAPTPFRDAVRTCSADALRILMWEAERLVMLPTVRAAHPAPSAITLAIGPEGGFADEEVAAARTAGFVVSGLGPRTLRAETAAIVALTLCQATWGDMQGELT
jgi:16S rRNA (uracil1498-N3)-methyltransferase